MPSDGQRSSPNQVGGTSFNPIYKNAMCPFVYEKYMLFLIARTNLEQILLKRHVFLTCYLKSMCFSNTKGHMTFYRPN